MEEQHKDLVVVKYGSSSVTNHNGMDTERLKTYADHLARLKKAYDIIVVSSGSVKTGQAIWNRFGRPITESDQPYAMLGSAGVVTAWQAALGRHNIAAGQLLVTHKEMDTDTGELHSALEQNLRHDIVTIVNENDAVSVVELAKYKYGADNDGLAAHVVRLMGAEALFLMTDQRGVLRREKYIVSDVGANEDEWDRVRSYVDDESTKRPSGMASKVEACIEVAKVGIQAYIGNAGVSFETIASPSNDQGTHFFALNQAA